MVRRLVLIVITVGLVLACVIQASAKQQDEKRARELEQVRKKILARGVGSQATVEVQLKNGTRVLGVIYRADEKDFTLIEIPTHRAVQIAYSDVKKVRTNLKAALNRKALLAGLAVVGGIILIAR